MRNYVFTNCEFAAFGVFYNGSGDSLTVSLVGFYGLFRMSISWGCACEEEHLSLFGVPSVFSGTSLWRGGKSLAPPSGFFSFVFGTLRADAHAGVLVWMVSCSAECLHRFVVSSSFFSLRAFLGSRTAGLGHTRSPSCEWVSTSLRHSMIASVFVRQHFTFS